LPLNKPPIINNPKVGLNSKGTAAELALGYFLK
jgi:hypothetical protein